MTTVCIIYIYNASILNQKKIGNFDIFTHTKAELAVYVDCYYGDLTVGICLCI